MNRQDYLLSGLSLRFVYVLNQDSFVKCKGCVKLLRSFMSIKGRFSVDHNPLLLKVADNMELKLMSLKAGEIIILLRSCKYI